MDRMGDKLAENLLAAIAKSRTPDLANLIYGLGIRNVGYHLAGVLAKTFKSIDKLAEQGIEELTEVHEVGPIVAQSLHNYFQNPKNPGNSRQAQKRGRGISRGRGRSRGGPAGRKDLCPYRRPGYPDAGRGEKPH